MNTLKEFQNILIPEFIRSLETFVKSSFPKGFPIMKEIYKYHLGLDDDYSQQGKRIRPFLTLLCCAGTGSEWQKALPAAVSIELIHNFSLIHDDIEDNGLKRRGKDTVWIKWGLPHGLNAGDAMFSSAFEVLFTLKENVSESLTLNAMGLLAETCGQLTKGQLLDIDFEERESVSVAEYLQMVNYKTAALISCSTKMGALIGSTSPFNQEKYYEFGKALGIAFQIYDDWLGVWGDFRNTGKSTTGDIEEEKKTLPIILGIKNSKRFANKFKQGNISKNIAIEMADWLREDGIEEKVIDTYTQWSEKALNFINEMECSSQVRDALIELTNKLLIREK